MLTKYSLSVRVGQPEGLLNIVLLITSDQADADISLIYYPVDIDQPDGLSNIIWLTQSS
jgi:hypothetical protein